MPQVYLANILLLSSTPQLLTYLGHMIAEMVIKEVDTLSKPLPTKGEHSQEDLRSNHSSFRYGSDLLGESGKQRSSSARACVLHIGLIVLHTMIFGLALHVQPSDRFGLIYLTPAKSAWQYERKTLWTNLDNSSFAGSPTPALDEAWHQLLQFANIKITRDELRKVGKHSLAFTDDSGFLAELGVYHELHCIKRIRQYLFLDYYYPNLTESQLARELFHINHCLEYLREIAICRGDPSITTFFWRDGIPTAYVDSKHECVKWDSITSWAKPRSTTVDPTALVGYKAGK